eukprot:CAMPEP_0119346254 /NCGR_PEP_ID=MMETSP1333-20130426/107910_1 /TAXON_ID=418940 /ORGANISM="Scyphosphaera apsteinii, Strain RCC1455" /LENGTH=206 /DNA_ID=CAMNT_0007358753 /DNA_START=695 /DNA_END=1315 /DNA_ORIENTATION=+
MYSSFRFTDRRVPDRKGALCNFEQRLPRFSFDTAVELLHNNIGRKWAKGVEGGGHDHILGRFTEGFTKEVYTPFFGTWWQQHKRKGTDGGRWHQLAPRRSALLAKLTVAHCFTWVGIAEQMPLSLALLKAELPHFFGSLNTAHPRLKWSPASSREDTPMTNRSLAFLRSHLLPNDYMLYDAERARLFRRAVAAGIAVITADELNGR